MSTNNQFIQFEDKIVKRYTKTIPGLLTGYRLDPHRPENRLDWVLKSPESSFKFVSAENGSVQLERIAVDYEQEVLELYSEDEVKLFNRLNRAAIEKGYLTEYSDTAPEVDTSNILSEQEVKDIAELKQLLAFKKRLSVITSLQTLDRIESAVYDLNRPISFAKAMKERKDDVKRDNIS